MAPVEIPEKSVRGGLDLRNERKRGISMSSTTSENDDPNFFITNFEVEK